MRRTSPVVDWGEMINQNRPLLDCSAEQKANFNFANPTIIILPASINVTSIVKSVRSAMKGFLGNSVIRV